MKKERLLEISYGRLMRYIVFAYLLRRTRVHTHTHAQSPGGINICITCLKSSPVVYDTRCYVCGVLELDALSRCSQPIDHTNQIRSTRIDTAVINIVQQ